MAWVLILGGTREARMLAELLTSVPGLDVTTSLVGRTREPALPEGAVRTGGFGGAVGLADYLRAENIALVADATHPFAGQISRNAVTACDTAGVPYVRLERPAWTPRPGDDWQRVAGIQAAADVLESGATALVTVGRQELAPFFARGDLRCVARMIEPPEIAVPGNCKIILARPPFTEEQERTLFYAEDISVLVTKNSGGTATATKLEAARNAGLPVIMVERPALPDAETASDAETLADVIAARLG